MSEANLPISLKPPMAVHPVPSAASFTTPVIFIVFNRPHTTAQVFAEIRAIRPQQLLVIADGPRADKLGEAEACAQARQIATAIDWPCRLHTCFSDRNLGCDTRIVSGLDWAFSLVEEAIILEDDCLPDPSFFSFCAELLARYRGDSRIAAISGTNLIQDKLQAGQRGTPASPHSYYFSLLGGSWGWATWASQWARLDREIRDWPALRAAGALEQVFDDARGRKLWNRIFNELHRAGEASPWDYRWTYTKIFAHRLTAVPSNNLVRNIGFGPGASHTTTADSRHMPALRRLAFPLVHPPAIVWARRNDALLHKQLDYDLRRRILSRIRRLLGRAA